MHLLPFNEKSGVMNAFSIFSFFPFVYVRKNLACRWTRTCEPVIQSRERALCVWHWLRGANLLPIC